MKILLQGKLTNYSIKQLDNLLAHKLLTFEEYTEELYHRGWSNWKINTYVLHVKDRSPEELIIN